MGSEKRLNCPNCGAPITTEICPYCGAKTWIDTEHADMEYPVLDCKEANIGFWTVAFPAIFALSFGYAGIAMPIMLMSEKSMFGQMADFGGFSLLFFLPFTLIGIVATVFTIVPIYRFIFLKLFGKQITATVYGYMNDKVMLNDRPAQVVKLLVQSPVGPRFIMYQLGKIDHPYRINSTIDLLVYKNYFMIINKKEVVNW